MTAGSDWIASLPAELTRQRDALSALLAHCEAMPAVTSLSVGCSLGRGAGDALSDVDAAIGVHAGRGPGGAEAVREVEAATVRLLPSLGLLVDVLRQESTGDTFFLRRVLAQYDDGLQLDLAVVAEADVRRGDAAPDFVDLYRSRPGPVGEPSQHPSALRADAGQLRDWVHLGWRALLDADKYLRRGSAWEVHQRLDETRDHIWRLWAAGHGATYPWHGLSQVLDHDPDLVPARIEETVAGLDLDDLRRGVLAAADVLDDVTEVAGRRYGIELRTPISGYARRVITRRRDDADGRQHRP